MTVRTDPRLYGRAGVADGFDPRAPLQCTEKDHQHRCVGDTECYDCGRLIEKGDAMIVSALECTQGVKGKSYRYQVHPACYDVLGRVVMLLGKKETHTFEGRPSLREMWRDSHAVIQKRDKPLAELLEKGLGKP